MKSSSMFLTMKPVSCDDQPPFSILGDKVTLELKPLTPFKK